MTIPDDKIKSYLDSVFGTSDPGDILHHLLVLAAEPGSQDAFGLVDTDRLEGTMYGIAPDDKVDAGDFVADAIMSAKVQARRGGKVVHFAALTIEAHKVPPTLDEVAENRARRMQADRKLHEHPDAAEVTILYAACSDGRRWVGEHYLTGPTAGTTVGPDVRVGGLSDDELGPHQRLVRMLVAP